MNDTSDPNEMQRDCFLPAPGMSRLEHALAVVSRSFGEQCYLVGSATRTRGYRDVDVRMIMKDEKFEALFGNAPGHRWIPFWSLLMTSISLYLKEVTGFEIDFQIQKRSDADKKFPKGHRVPLSLGVVNEVYDPPWMKVKK